jgi:Zn-finger nucleic acid-binding protein
MIHEDEDDTIGCEWCDWIGPTEQQVHLGDVDVCPECYAKWRKHFETCVHNWTRHSDDYGDEGQYCPQCGVFVEDGSAMKLFPLICDGWVQDTVA